MGAHGVPLEMVGAVMEITDVAWSALEHRREHARCEAAKEHDRAALESALAQERSENERLRATLQQYHTALQNLQANHNNSSPSSFLSPLDCPNDFSERLKQKLQSPEYIERLQHVQQKGENVIHDDSLVKAEDGSLVDTGIEDPSWWVWVAEDDLSVSQPKFEPGGLDAEGYVVVTEEDIIDGIANFLAQYIASMPEAKKMSCTELHEAVTKAFMSIDRIGKLKKLWAMGKILYTLASLGTSAIWIYRHPIILRGAFMAVKTSAKLVVKAIT
ncbi:hypothetical protein O6H91_06G096600 [Diphasiastrum complanatum]|uniref:Uncharacterized protein n=1 Tax=Diphasiastrum complanatum TaxID=34168 RepID=A0ACC2DGU7_DIPCM|nr:hypothetical protein O6H91_06G096600 [Diphasiastrum complanatum]